jgi:hypothetical protein
MDGWLGRLFEFDFGDFVEFGESKLFLDCL